MKRLIAVLCLTLAAPAAAASGGAAPYAFEPDTGNLASMQRGVRNYMGYCAGCHSLKYLRYNRIAKDLEIPEELMAKHLMPQGAKAGDTIASAMPATSAQWFGRMPPDLTLTARERGPDWLYSYLLTFYVDEKQPAGVNNLMLPGLSMPHVLAGLQGLQKLKPAADPEHHGPPEFELVQKGSMTPAEYKSFVADLSNFLVYAAEPGRNDRIAMGGKVLLFILLFWGMAVLLKKEYWKDVH